jgi:hypothetical protein
MTSPMVGRCPLWVILSDFNRLLAGIAALGLARELPSFEARGGHELTIDD